MILKSKGKYYLQDLPVKLPPKRRWSILQYKNGIEITWKSPADAGIKLRYDTTGANRPEKILNTIKQIKRALRTGCIAYGYRWKSIPPEKKIPLTEEQLCSLKESVLVSDLIEDPID